MYFIRSHNWTRRQKQRVLSIGTSSTVETYTGCALRGFWWVGDYKVKNSLHRVQAPIPFSKASVQGITL